MELSDGSVHWHMKAKNYVPVDCRHISFEIFQRAKIEQQADYKKKTNKSSELCMDFNVWEYVL